MSLRRDFLRGAAGILAVGAFGEPALSAEAARVVLLGTAGGPSPKRLRAAPAQAVLVGDAAYIVDCGDGVARQMRLAGIPLTRIRAVFITHQHSDHNAGYGNLLLLGWASGLQAPVHAYGPPPLAKMTRLFAEMNRYDIETRMRDEGRPPFAGLVVPHEIRDGGLVMQDDRVRVTAALVDHPPVRPAFAYRFEAAGRSIVFSGDTAPSPSLVALAKGADVLVHEVIYVPGIEGLVGANPRAVRLREHLLASHTPTTEVGRIAAEAGVKTLVLTHLVPGDDESITDEMWAEGARARFKGEIVVGRDLLSL
jgi:ribonuclease BN (tRNA processing enzyme)